MSKAQRSILVFVVGGLLGCAAGGGSSTRADVRRPTASDLERLTGDPAKLVDRLLSVIEEEIVPLTREGVRTGSKIFGGAVLAKSDLSTVLAATNDESANPLNHGEVHLINTFYAIPRTRRPAARDCIFLATHEPCPLCLSAITWAGFDNFFYLFSYEDTKDAFNIPHDLKILDEVFRCPDGGYSPKNHYWSSWGMRDLIDGLEPEARTAALARVRKLRATYDRMSAIYQKSKHEGAEIPLD